MNPRSSRHRPVSPDLSPGCCKKRSGYGGGTVLLLPLLILLGGCGDDPSSPPSAEPPFELSDFEAPQTCAECHPNHYAEWAGSMHAYSFEDPLFFTFNFAEQESTSGALGQWCNSCHSPVGPLTGTTSDFFDPGSLPDVVKAGIHCDVCHTIESPTLEATEERVELAISPGDTKYGQLPGYDLGPDVHKVEQRLFYENSSYCRPCHNVIINGLDVEVTYDEWENSIYAPRGDSQCQNCHMPTYAGQAAVDGPQRERVHRHWFTGVDVALTDFPDHEANLQRVDALLKNAVTFSINTPASVVAGDTAVIAVTVYNDKTGHAIPSGTSFARQMWVELSVADAGGDTLYQSGHLDANGDLRDASSDPDLVLFNSEVEVSGATVFTITQLTNRMLYPFDRRDVAYRVAVPAGVPGPLAVSARLRFRPFAPSTVRGAGHADLVPRIPIFDMAVEEAAVSVR